MQIPGPWGHGGTGGPPALRMEPIRPANQIDFDFQTRWDPMEVHRPSFVPTSYFPQSVVNYINRLERNAQAPQPFTADTRAQLVLHMARKHTYSLVHSVPAEEETLASAALLASLLPKHPSMGIVTTWVTSYFYDQVEERIGTNRNRSRYLTDQAPDEEAPEA